MATNYNVIGSLKMRKALKIKLIQENQELFDKAFIFNEYAEAFVKLARKKIGYSKKTISFDIFCSFKRLTKETKK